MKRTIAVATLALLAGCAGITGPGPAASGSTASDESVPLYFQNPANCAEAGFNCRRR